MIIPYQTLSPGCRPLAKGTNICAVPNTLQKNNQLLNYQKGTYICARTKKKQPQPKTQTSNDQNNKNMNTYKNEALPKLKPMFAEPIQTGWFSPYQIKLTPNRDGLVYRVGLVYKPPLTSLV